MAATTFGVVYATGSKMVRRIILPDDDKELLNGNHVGSGETMLVSPAGPSDLFTCQALVKQATGVAPPDASCAVVDKTNAVAAVILADPALDSHPDGVLVSCYSPQISVGCTYDPASGLFSTAPFTIPAGTVDRVTKQPSAVDVVIPAAVIPKPSVVTASL